MASGTGISKTKAAIIALAVIFAADLVWLAASPAWLMIPAALVGWYGADLMSGVVHMTMDFLPCREGIGLDRLFFYDGCRESADYLSLRAQVLGQLSPLERLVFDFKNHHPRPDALGRRSMLVQIGSTILFATLPFAIVANLAFLLLPLPHVLLAAAVSLGIGATFAQYFHGTLHRADNPASVRIMRRLGLLMRPRDHVRHHDRLDCDFSTINGWSNPLLNLVFRILRSRGFMPDEGLVPH